ncbi:hypothetical protein NHX12_014227 [Muraenolepis orangiensis]|uniref:Claudin n=1 Tax=Muraenolepis orangiensis TaxID=630683 RepID=A0A9Q0I5E6_9TELE|nr:hypothetical protein NHX12_014227 [Muraenolepis orangiensis]
MDPIVEVVALLLGFLGWVLAGVALPNRYWKTSTVSGTVITTSTIYENLWMSCASDSTGVHDCREFPSLLALNGYIQASRALMITSIVLGAFGIVATLVGIQDASPGRGGSCSSSRDFFNPMFPGIKYEIGEGLYIGWCSAVLAIAGGSCLTCSCRLATEEK